MNNPFVSIIIPTYNDWSRLATCLDALMDQSYPLKNFEIVVVNNNPYDVAPDFVHFPPNSKLLTENKPGSYAARNAAIAATTGDIIGFTDSDCIPNKNWISNAVNLFHQNKDIDRIGGAINIFYKNVKSPTVVELYEAVFAFQQAHNVVQNGTSVTANLFVTRHALCVVGVFNDKLLSSGDFEWNSKAQKAGLKIVYGENVIVNHPARSEFIELSTKSKRIAGGIYQKYARNNKVIKFYLSLIKRLLPTFNELNLIFSKEEISASQKLLVFFVRYRLKMIQVKTLINLRQGQEAERL